ncbi:MAG TPA: selenium-dependent molybdenum cofactor biosynthesis protein YqeB [Anaerolineales bacterium]|nr:selenium-dependent molybdenum cofactor biosynthesis protein YqeB [Anaerolineales bacterium]
MALKAIILGGGDLASGVASRLFRSDIPVIITELPEPIMVRRLVSFGEAMYRGEFTVEGITAQRTEQISCLPGILEQGKIPVIHVSADNLLANLEPESPVVVIDARMRKKPPEFDRNLAPLVVGLGPGFVAGENCHAVIETQRGHMLGRVLWQGEALNDTGIPDRVNQFDSERVLRSPVDGFLEAFAEIGDYLQPGQLVARVGEDVVFAPFRGVLRGMLHAGLHVHKNMKIGDVDPRNDPRYVTLVSDKSLAIGGAVLEAILSRSELRPSLWKQAD